MFEKKMFSANVKEGLRDWKTNNILNLRSWKCSTLIDYCQMLGGTG